MTAAQNMLAGLGITAAMLRGIAPNAVTKTADEPVTSSTTIQADNALVVPVGANTRWIWLAMVSYNGQNFDGSSGIAGGLAEAWNLPSGASAAWASFGYGSGTSMNLVLSTLQGAGAGAPNHNSNGTDQNLILIYLGTATVGNTAGNLQFAWAQAKSNATATTVKSGSWMSAWQVG